MNIIKKQKNLINISLFLLFILILIVIFIDPAKNYQYYHKQSRSYAVTANNLRIKRICGIEKSDEIEKIFKFIKKSDEIEKTCKFKKTCKIESDKNDLSSLYCLMGIHYLDKAYTNLKPTNPYNHCPIKIGIKTEDKNYLFKAENLEKARIAFENSLNFYEKNEKYDLFYTMVCNNLSWVLLEQEYLLDKKNLNERKYCLINARNNLNKALSYRYKESIPYVIIQCNFLMSLSNKKLGEINLKQKNFNDALQNFKDAKQNLNEVNKIINNEEFKEGIINSNYYFCISQTKCFYYLNPKNYEDFKELVHSISKQLRKELGTLQGNTFSKQQESHKR